MEAGTAKTRHPFLFVGAWFTTAGNAAQKTSKNRKPNGEASQDGEKSWGRQQCRRPQLSD